MEKGHDLHESIGDGDKIFVETYHPYAIFIYHGRSYAPNFCSSIIGAVNVTLQETITGRMPFDVHREAILKRMR